MTIRIAVVCGNPRPGSRTLTTARTLAASVGDHFGAPQGLEVDLADLGPAILAQPASPELEAALEVAAGADVLVVATPVYKASITGLLKAFLDRLPAKALRGVIAVPLTVAGAPHHHLVADFHLRPVLLELGAITPTAALPVTEAQLPELDGLVADWVHENVPAISAILAAREKVSS